MAWLAAVWRPVLVAVVAFGSGLVWPKETLAQLLAWSTFVVFVFTVGFIAELRSASRDE